MFSHIMLGANDLEASKAFYDAVLGELGAKPGVLSPNSHGHKRYFYFLSGSIFIISQCFNYYSRFAWSKTFIPNIFKI